MKPESEVAFAPEHPAFAGHFPGFPIVPGVMLLDAIVHLHESQGGGKVTAIASAKFLRPVGPGQSVTFSFKPGAGRQRFEIRDGEQVVGTGQLVSEP